MECYPKNKNPDTQMGIWIFGFGDNYGYNLRRQFDKGTPVAKFAPQGARMHPGTFFAPCTDKVHPKER